MIKATPDPGSFRDPRGRIYRYNDKIFRAISHYDSGAFETLDHAGVYKKLISKNLLLPFSDVTQSAIETIESSESYVRVVEHPRISFVSYPYEWSFQALKAAALAHLDLHLAALDLNASLSDGSAYNVQFQGAKPIFIDLLSLRKYKEGEPWMGHRQFCEQFLAPLLLYAALSVKPNAWYRGAQEGIALPDLIKLLPFRWRIRPTVFTNLVLTVRTQNFFDRRGWSAKTNSLTAPNVSKRALYNMLMQLRFFIESLSAKNEYSAWSDYSIKHNYQLSEHDLKHKFLKEFAEKYKPNLFFDIGCNTGEFSFTMLSAGAHKGIGFDTDFVALDRSFEFAYKKDLNFLPLYFDAANPSPDQGWNQLERQGLAARAKADAVIALAFIHHLVIGRNLPVENAVKWIMSLAPRGVIEFVPPEDPTVTVMLSRREKYLFSEYSEENFISAVNRFGRIISTQVVSLSGRRLYCFERFDCK